VSHSSWASARKGSRQLVGRLDLDVAAHIHMRSGGCRFIDLRFLRTSADRWCPLLSVVCRSAAHPARTAEVRPHLVVDASGAAVVRIRDGMGRTAR
jgi:hypothetical protein